MPEPQGATARTLAELTIGTIQSMQERQKGDAEVVLQETTQQFQIEISAATGGGTGPIAWANIDILFDYEFYYAPGQRDSDLRYPQFYYGVEAVGPDGAAGTPVAMFACVTQWALNEDTSAVIGVTVALGAFFAEATTSECVVHLSFQGFTALTDVEVDFPED